MTMEEDIVLRAKIRLQKESPFFSYLVQTLNIEVNEKPPMKTACVDKSKNVSLHPKFVAAIGEDATTGVLIHEIMHVALDHFGRTGDRDPELTNIAQDIVINDLICENGFTLPEICNDLVPEHHTLAFDGVVINNIDAKTWEEIYEELVKGGAAKKQTFDTKIEPVDGDREGQGEAQEEDIKRREAAQKLLSEAMAYAKIRGDMPSGIESRLDALLASKVDWREVLAHYVSKSLPYDYSFARPSKKSRDGLYMPSIQKEGLEVVIALDTSGSIGKEDIQQFASETLGIATSFNGVKISLIQADAAVQSDDLIEGDYEELISNITIKGGGGTSHVPVFEHVLKEHPEARVLICFTDGFTNYPEEEPSNIDTIWAINNRSQDAPFGKIVRICFDEEVNECGKNKQS